MDLINQAKERQDKKPPEQKNQAKKNLDQEPQDETD